MDEHLRLLQRRFLSGDTTAAGSLFIGEYRAHLLSQGSIHLLATLGFEPARSVMPISTLLIPKLSITVFRKLSQEHCFQLAVMMLAEGFSTFRECYTNDWSSTQALFPLIFEILNSYQQYTWPAPEISELYPRYVMVRHSQIQSHQHLPTRALRAPTARRDRYLASLVDHLHDLGYLLRDATGIPTFSILPAEPSDKLLKLIIAIDNLVTCIRTDAHHGFALPQHQTPEPRVGRSHRLRLRKEAGVIVLFGFDYPREELDLQRRNLYQSLSLGYLKFLQTE